jgi:hypothetical protein
MPGALVVNVNTSVGCVHGGRGRPLLSVPRVKVNGAAVVTVASAYTIAACPLQPPPIANGPCVSAAWVPLTAAKRVKVMGQPLLILSSQAICTPTGTGVLIGPAVGQVTAT